MLAHLGPLLLCQLPRLPQYGIRDPYLADIMEERASAKDLQVMLLKTQHTAYLKAIPDDTLGVPLCLIVPVIQGRRKGIEGRTVRHVDLLNGLIQFTYPLLLGR